MRRALAACVVVVVVVLATGIGTQLLRSDPEHARPDHTEPPVAEVTAPVPLAAVGGETPQAVISFLEGVARADWYAGVEQAEHDRQAALAAMAARRPAGSPTGSVGSGDCAALAQQLGLPESILWRESRCTWDAYNATGCGGRGCVGPAQIDAGHTQPVSPWGGPGACADLDLNDPGQYAECVGRLSGGGSNLAPWGG